MKATSRRDFTYKWAAAVGILLIAAWFRTFRLDTVPPGPHHDAIINGQIVQEMIWPALPEPLRPASPSPVIPWLAIQANVNGPDLQEHAWLYQSTLAATLAGIGRNVIGMRFPDVFWGMLGVSACYALARRLFGRNVAILAAALQAVSFWSVLVGRSGLRAGTIVPVLALSGCAFWDAWRGSNSASIRRFLASGALLGLSIYGYLSARPMVAVLLVFAVYLVIVRLAAWRKLLPGLAALLATAFIVTAPLIYYLRTHPEENLRFNMLSGPLQDLAAGKPGTALYTGLATLGMFVWRGDPQWQYNVAGRPVFEPLGALLFVAGVGLALWRWRRPAYAFALIWLSVGLLPGMLSLPAPHSTRTVAAQAVVYALAALGGVGVVHAAQRLLRRPAGQALPAWGALLLAAWWLGFAAWNYQGYFQVWANNDEVWFYHQGGITQMARYLDRRDDTTPVAACSVFLNEHEDFIRSPRQTFDFVLQRRDLPVRWFDCRDSFVIPSGGQARIMFPALVPYDLTLGSEFAPWMQASTPVHDDLLPDGTLFRLDAAASLAGEVVSLAASSEVEWAPEAGINTTPQLPVDFDHTLEFLGYRVDKTRRQAGKDVRILTYWRVLKSPPLFLTGFVHLLSGPDHVLAQHDRQGLLADTLQPGDVFIQLYDLTIPPDTPPGAYRLSTGWYIGPTQQRLTVYQGSEPRSNRLMLQSIDVRP